MDVFPMGLTALALGGFRGELWICPGHKVTQGEQLRRNEQDTEPGVALVLGAGNQYPLAILDILQMLALQSRVVVCKMNPVNEYVGPLLRKALAPLVREGFVEFVYGGADVGEMLVDHPLVKNIHLTGSEATYDRIVWKGEDKAKRTGPPLGKHVGAELGCVTPYIIIPGEWDDEMIEYHAANVVSWDGEQPPVITAWALRCSSRTPPGRKDNSFSTQSAGSSMPPACAPHTTPGSADKFARFDKLFPDCENYGQEAAPRAVRVGQHVRLAFPLEAQDRPLPGNLCRRSGELVRRPPGGGPLLRQLCRRLLPFGRLVRE